MEISIFQLIHIAWKKWYVILAAALLLALLAGLFIGITGDEQYSASATIFLTTEENNQTITSSQTSALSNMIDTYNDLIRSERVMNTVRLHTGTAYTNRQLGEKLKITKNENSFLLKLTFTGSTREEAVDLANAISNVSVAEIQTIIDSYYGLVIDLATVSNTQDVSPSPLKWGIIGFLLGAIIAYAFLFLHFILDTTVHHKEDLQVVSDLPVIGQIPALETEEEENTKGKVK